MMLVNRLSKQSRPKYLKEDGSSHLRDNLAGGDYVCGTSILAGWCELGRR